MNSKICNRCNLEKDINDFELQKDKNKHRNICKECRNLQRRENYQKNKEEILKKKREYYHNHLEQCRNYRKKIDLKNKKSENKEPKERLKSQLVRSINHSFERKNIKKTKSTNEILGCKIEEAVERLLWTYKAHYRKEWDGIVKVEIDHIIPIMYAHTEEQMLKLCRISNLHLLTKEENHRKGGKLSNGIGKNGQVKYEYYYGDFFDDDDDEE